MGNWRDPVDGRDFELPPRPKEKNIQQPLKKIITPDRTTMLTSILSGLSVFLICIVIVLGISISSQMAEIESYIENKNSSLVVLTQTLVSTPPIPTATDLPLPSFTPVTQLPSIIRRESFSELTALSVSLGNGELLVGTAMKFAIHSLNCNTVDINENNTPSTIFLIRGPIEVDIEIYNGDWEYWEKVYDDNFAKNLLNYGRDWIKQDLKRTLELSENT